MAKQTVPQPLSPIRGDSSPITTESIAPAAKPRSPGIQGVSCAENTSIILKGCSNKLSPVSVYAKAFVIYLFTKGGKKNLSLS